MPSHSKTEKILCRKLLVLLLNLFSVGSVQHSFCFQGLSQLSCARWSQVLSHKTIREHTEGNNWIVVLICVMPERTSLSLPWRSANRVSNKEIRHALSTVISFAYLRESSLNTYWLARHWASCVGLLGCYCVWGRIMRHWETKWFFSDSFYRLVLFSPGYKVVLQPGLLTSASHIHLALNLS